MKKPAPTGRDKASIGNTAESSAESWVHRTLSVAAQVASLIGIVGFILAIIINSIIFRQWGLTFLQVATPGDVVLSGFYVALALAFPVAAAFVGWSLGKYLAIRGSMIWQVLLIIVCIGVVVVTRTDVEVPVPKLEHLTAFFASGVIWSMGYYIEFVVSDLNFSRPARRIAPVILGTLLVLAVGPPTVQATREAGMFGEGLGYGAIPAPAGCAAPYVLWTGERAIIIRCRSGQITILMYPRGLQIDRIRPASAETEPRPVQRPQVRPPTNSPAPTPLPPPRSPAKAP